MAILPSLASAATAAHISSLAIARSSLSTRKSCRVSAELASAFLGTNFGLKRAVSHPVEAKRSLVVEAKRMESQEVAVTRAPDFEVRNFFPSEGCITSVILYQSWFRSEHQVSELMK